MIEHNFIMPHPTGSYQSKYRRKNIVPVTCNQHNNHKSQPKDEKWFCPTQNAAGATKGRPMAAISIRFSAFQYVHCPTINAIRKLERLEMPDKICIDLE
ncbi:MAG: hypothetical protein Q7U53_02350 [Anaerolineaceae bacterium]|nr:hypothetical protein [Anaerolineaceae bacterium]